MLKKKVQTNDRDTKKPERKRRRGGKLEKSEKKSFLVYQGYWRTCNEKR